MTLKGIIDTGSNSVRLVVYDVDKSSAKRDPKKCFRKIVDEKKIIGLSAYVENGVLTDEGIERAEKALMSHLRAAKNVKCDEVSIFATAVLRNCENSEKVVRAIEKSINKKIHVLSPAEEAHLGYIGASIATDITDGTLVDIGGGSTELSVVGKTEHDISIPQGCVSSYANFVSVIFPKRSEESEIRKSFKRNLKDFGDMQIYAAKHLFGIGGSVRAVAKMHGAIFCNGKTSEIITADQISQLRRAFQSDLPTFAHAATRVCPDRIHSVVPGMIILETLMQRFGAEDIKVCRYGIREGYLLEHVLKQ